MFHTGFPYVREGQFEPLRDPFVLTLTRRICVELRRDPIFRIYPYLEIVRL